MHILNPLASVVYLAHLGVNITMLFVAVKLLLQFRAISWLVQLDKIGGTLADSVANSIGNVVNNKCRKHLSEKGKLVASMAVLTLADILLVSLINACP